MASSSPITIANLTSTELASFTFAHKGEVLAAGINPLTNTDQKYRQGIWLNYKAESMDIQSPLPPVKLAISDEADELQTFMHDADILIKNITDVDNRLQYLS